MIIFIDDGGGGPGALYWDPAKKGANITLSSGDTVATGSLGFNTVLSVTGHNSGKWYAEIKLVPGSSYWEQIIGVATAGVNVGNYLGSDANGWGYQPKDHTLTRYQHGGASVSVSPPISAEPDGGYARIVYDADAGNVWFGNSTEWLGGGNPSAGTTPTFTVTPGTLLYIGGALYGGVGLRIRTAAADFDGAIVTGAGAWG